MKLGVIGGLGPIATAYFLELVINMTDAACDQDHLDMIIYNTPSTPDRTAFILGKSTDSPLATMIETGRRLVEQGVDYIAIPCITAHYFHKELQDSIDKPIINIIRQTALHLKQNGVQTTGIAATDGTIAGRLFQKELDALGIRSLVPSAGMQRYVTELIYDNIKAGIPVDMDKFNYVSQELRRGGAEAIILGCTELSLIKRDYPIGPGYLDAMEVLAKDSVVSCQAPLKNRFQCLIS
ncbi:MAG: aspartate/glutamate racemase family protein [Saccharofermentanales bacterium]